MGYANSKSIDELRWASMQDAKITAAAVVEQSFEEHNAQLYLALALLCKVAQWEQSRTSKSAVDWKRDQD